MCRGKTLRLAAMLFVFLLTFAPCTYARTISVDDDGPADYKTIQAAIDAAVDGDTVIISPGTYTGPGNRDIDFKGKAITVRSVDPNDPNVVAATIIDCEKQGRGFYLNGCAGTTIAGLTITNGLANAGGGIYIEKSDATICNCRILDNTTKDGQDGWVKKLTVPGYDLEIHAPTDGGDGAGLFLKSSSVSVADCNVSGNMAGVGGNWSTNEFSGADRGIAGAGGDGGGIYCYDSSLTLQHCVLRANSSGAGGNAVRYNASGGDGGSGSGLCCESSCSVQIIQSVVAGNTTGNGGSAQAGLGTSGGSGGDGGGILCKDNCSLVIRDSTIAENKSGQGGNAKTGGSGGNGGAVCCVGYCVAVIGNSEIRNNSTGQGGTGDWAFGGPGQSGYGGGVYCDESSSFEIEDSEIAGNALAANSRGSGGGVYCVSAVPLKVKNTQVVGNKASMGGWHFCGTVLRPHGGGGIFCLSAKIDNSTIRNNATGPGVNQTSELVSVLPGGCGGAICCLEALEIIDCRIVENRSGNGGNGNYGGGKGGDGAGIWADSVTATGCHIIGNVAGNAGSGGMHGTSGDGGSGAGIYCREATISNCFFQDNVAGKGGNSGANAGNGGNGAGLYCIEKAAVSGSVFSYNATGNRGDGAATSGSGGNGAALFSQEATIHNCMFFGNMSGYGAFGGWPQRYGGRGAGVYTAKGNIDNCLFVGNRTNNGPNSKYNSSPGGDTSEGAAIWCSEGVVSNCTISQNCTGQPGTSPNGKLKGKRGKGGGIGGDKDLVIVDSILWGNSPDQLYDVNCANISFCDIQDSNCLGLHGNISADPLFIQPGHWADANDPNITVEPNDPNALWIMGDYHLSQVAAGQTVNSPCVDAGSDTAANLGLDEFTTRTDSIADSGIVDMGYHYPIPLAADLNDDGKVNFNDYTLFAEQWQQTNESVLIPMDADLDSNGLVDFRDLSILAQHWLENYMGP